jgi:hypothetical protein
VETGYIDGETGKAWIKGATEISSMLGSLVKTKRGFIKKDST